MEQENATPHDFGNRPSEGDIVNYHSIIGGPVTSEGHRVESIFYNSVNGWLARISDKPGYVSVCALSPAGNRPDRGQGLARHRAQLPGKVDAENQAA